jgi:hypothetical protein
MFMKSLWHKIQHLEGMINTVDFSSWESEFIRSIVQQCENGNTMRLSERQVERIELLHAKHFAD